MPSISIKHFLGNVSVGDKKDLRDANCVRQKNMVCSNGLFKSRECYKKLDGVTYTARINMLYHFKMPTGGSKTLIASGGNLYSA